MAKQSLPAKPAKVKKTKEEKKEKRVENVKKLKAQKEVLLDAQRNGHAPAVKLGKIIRGRGDYTIGKNLGSNVGGWIGDKMEKFIRNIFGSGDYTIDAPGSSDIKANSLIAGSSIPSFGNKTGALTGGIVIANHEFIRNINMTSAFTVTSIPIDISSADLFPWVSRISVNYQQWLMKGGVVIYKSLSSDTSIAPTQGMGSVFASIRYDVYSDPPTNKSEILNSMFASSAKPSQNQAFPIECSMRQSITPVMKVVQPGTVPPDLQFYRMGWIDIATEGAANDYDDAGELHITYEVEFFKPRIEPDIQGTNFMVDLAIENAIRPIKPIADSFAVKQPRVNGIGASITSDFRSVVFPLIIQKDSLWQFIYAVRGTVAYNTVSVSFAGAGGMVAATVIGDQVFSTVSNYQESGCPNDVILGIAYFRYDGTGSLVAPPQVQVNLGSGTALPDDTRHGSFFVSLVPSVFGSGLTAETRLTYSREELFQYLLDTVGSRVSKCPPPPGLGRLVDWTHQFSITPVWNITKNLPKSPSPFDQSFLEALTFMSKYVNAMQFHKETTDCKVDAPPEFIHVSQPPSTFRPR